MPPEQIIDTVNIYHLSSRQRKLSLRFLAWAVLHSAIQTDTHDSIEDARTALQLYEEHNRLEAEGTWEDVLEEVYREGKQTVRVPLLFIVICTQSSPSTELQGPWKRRRRCSREGRHEFARIRRNGSLANLAAASPSISSSCFPTTR